MTSSGGAPVRADTRPPALTPVVTEVLRARGRGLVTTSQVIRITVATTVSYMLAARYSQTPLPLFAPATALAVVQSSTFVTLGMAAQFVLSTAAGVLLATLWVNAVGTSWWSFAFAMLVALLAARKLPLSITGQLQIPVTVLFVMVIGPSVLHTDVWRVIDVLTGGFIGVAVMMLPPPRARMGPARAARDAWAAGIANVLDALATEIGTYDRPLATGERHRFSAATSSLRGMTLRAREAYDEAVDSARFNPRGRRAGSELDRLSAQVRWLNSVTVQVRALSSAYDRFYDRPGLPPVLPPATAGHLLRALAEMVRVVAAEGPAPCEVRSHLLRQEIRDALAQVTRGYQVDVVLQSITALGRIDSLRRIIAAGPPYGVVPDELADDVDEQDDPFSSPEEDLPDRA